MKNNLTSLTMVKNGEEFIKPALLSIKDYVDKMLICDTDSTDNTVKIIKELKKDGLPIELWQRGPFKGDWETGIPELTVIRNEMLKKTKTEWAIIIDDDEVYTKEIFEEIYENMENKEIISMAVPFIDLIDYKTINGNNIVSPANHIIRAKKVEFRGAWPNEMWFVKNEKNWLNKFKDPRVLTLKNHYFHYGMVKRSGQRPKINMLAVPFYGEHPKIIKEAINNGR